MSEWQTDSLLASFLAALLLIYAVLNWWANR